MPAHSHLYKSWSRTKLSHSDITCSITDSAILGVFFVFFLNKCNKSSSEEDIWWPSKNDEKVILKYSFACFGEETLACLCLLSCFIIATHIVFLLISALQTSSLFIGNWWSLSGIMQQINSFILCWSDLTGNTSVPCERAAHAGIA